MPVQQGKNSVNSYYRWGDHGKKYYYQANNKKSRELAKEKALKQGRAIHASGWKGK